MEGNVLNVNKCEKCENCDGKQVEIVLVSQSESSQKKKQQQILEACFDLKPKNK